MLDKLINKIIGDANTRLIKKLSPLVPQINEWEQKFQKELASDEDFPKKTQEFKERLKNGESLDDLLPEAFALAKNACRRLMGKQWEVRGTSKEWDMIPFDVQLIGGVVLHQGNIAEMKTGEGKTLVCTMPAYLNSLTNKGVFIVTVNDYLAQRDSEWMGGLYKFLGLTVGVIKHGQSTEEKKKAYACDIIYGTNNEFGFDYLRDNMAVNLERVVQRNLHYAIIDEVDSILIDEARTPLIISAPAEESTLKYKQYANLISQLEENVHYNIDEKLKTATLTEEGIAKMEKTLGVENIYTEAGFGEVHHIEQALKAQTVFKRDVDYVIKDDEVIIVDEFTGRMMPGRRYSDGLHQAIEAKEKVDIKRESRTLATVTFQNYFRLFEKLAGMTGTALTEAEEFANIYGLDTYAVPTNMPVVRDDKHDSIYKNTSGKFIAIANKIQELNKKGQPVLVGTISVEKSEILSQLLAKRGVSHSVLNAKYHEKEAEIIAKAGEKGAVTIATNMAGRGTDIRLGKGVKNLGGLFVLGTERHESRRIDNQLRGRSGRQGDPGTSQFFVSMEDDLMRLFGADRIKRMMEMMKVPDDMPIENRMISRSIEGAQKKVEGHHFDIRKHLVQYDDVMNKQREIIYSRRRKILSSENIKNDIILLIEKEAESVVLLHTESRDRADWNYQEIFETMNAIHRDPVYPLVKEKLEKISSQEELIQTIKKFLFREYEDREKMVPDHTIMRNLERNVYLHVIDALWMEHIDTMTKLREEVALHGYGQRDPLISYKEEGYFAFQKMLRSIEGSTVNTLFKVKIVEESKPPQGSSTSSYHPFQGGVGGGSALPANARTNTTDIEESLTGKGSEVKRGEPWRGDTAPTNSPHSQEGEPAPKVHPNDPCPCGSGKKYKKCCAV